MLRVVLLAEDDERTQTVQQAVELLGAKVISYHPAEGWVLVPKIEANAVIKALYLNGIAAELREIPR